MSWQTAWPSEVPKTNSAVDDSKKDVISHHIALDLQKSLSELMTPCLPQSTQQSALHEGTHCHQQSSSCTSRQPLTYPARQYKYTMPTLPQLIMITSKINEIASTALGDWFLYVNVDKTEHTIINHEVDRVAKEWRTTKNLLPARRRRGPVSPKNACSHCVLFHVAVKTTHQQCFYNTFVHPVLQSYCTMLCSLIGIHWPQRHDDTFLATSYTWTRRCKSSNARISWLLRPQKTLLIIILIRKDIHHKTGH